MKNANKNSTIILASKSPRRKYLLARAGLTFTVVPSAFDESAISLSSPALYARVLAESKAGEISEKYPEAWVIGADTIVLIDGLVLGKPGSIDEARSMLYRLSGQTHQVLTGYCIRCRSAERFFSETVKTDVTFKKLTEAEIEWYIHTDEPFDKAGAYAVQGLGTFLVKAIHGSYTNVVGLPVCEVIEFLIREGVVGFQVSE
ncbi:MAG: nucleoside triphosphate pyrophosphatase [Pseudomonadota bacterium]